MYSMHIFLVFSVLFLGVVKAELFVVEPLEGSTCQANQPCTVTWLDNGVRPLLAQVGLSTVGLYTGKQQLVQTITPVDVSTSHSVTFIPNPAAGPNSDQYYIAITSTTLKRNDSIPYSGWSAFFTLTGMSGSFDAPLPAATSSIPIPSTISTTNAVGTSTRVIGDPSTTSVASATKSATRMVTSSRPANLVPTQSSSSFSTSQSSSAAVDDASSTSLVTTTSASPTVGSANSTTSTTSTSISISTPISSSTPVTTGTSAAAVTTPATSSSSTQSASRFTLWLTAAASVIYSALLI